MCSVYEFGRGKKMAGVKAPVSGLDDFADAVKLVRRTDSAPVVLGGDEAQVMRWGFERKGLGVVNNTRSDNLDSPMWREAFAERRCLIPVLAFYEWSGAKGHKRTHRFTSPDGGLLWMAGIWEESQELGRCFSMLTTESNTLMEPIHNRMPAVLTPAECDYYLKGHMETFRPKPDLLEVTDAANPLLKNKPSHIQDELF
ncbi:SOS response-associated peptidase family protein [Verrucomicrobiaceae bacterium 5K15]|uniref:Abasic site processing protein n=1 Tax=Oceaniferula flava TaxID=2800421 RepID=A0AAE2VBZ3_9BACT|nr:SOS response-associated peptidase family protein [Oceaniferula flavus]MBK1855000.1 SOS response-associated peptidase family protein [Oceaniferula flavus]MBM1136306.1 SOS response-associated peptidase family protein [Oceaniferula flavus]